MKTSIGNEFVFLAKSNIKAGEGKESGLYPFFTSSDVKIQRIDMALYDTEAIILGTGGKPSCNYYAGRFSTSTDNFVLQSKGKVLPKYLYYFLRTNGLSVLEKGFKGAGLKHIGKPYISNIFFPIREPEGQKRIVEELDGVSSLISLIRNQIILLDEQVKSLFNEQFSDCPQIKNLEAIATLITDGEHQTPQRSETGYLLLSARNIGNHELLLNDVDHIPEGEYQRISRRVVPQEGDVLISCSGTIGRVCAVPANLQFQMVRSAALIRPAKTVRTKYLEYALTSEELQYQIQESAVAVAQANLFQGKIKKLRIRVPPLADQDKFIERLNQIDKLRFNYQRQIDLLKELMEKKMEEYFGGEEGA